MQRHDVDPTSLAFGLLFAVAGLMLLGGNSTAGTVWLGWTGPVVAIALGVLIVIAARPRRQPSISSADDGTDAGGVPVADD